MTANLTGIRIAVLGGDRREFELVRSLVQMGARVRVLGYPDGIDLAGAIRAEDVYATLEWAEVIIAPVTNTDAEGRIRAVPDGSEIRLDDSAMKHIGSGTPLFIGIGQKAVKEAAARHGVRLIEIAKIETIAVLNSVPTAEGALQYAMEEMDITICGSRSVVIGFGRCGQALGRLLLSLGSKTTVVARRAEQRAQARVMGLATVDFEQLASVCSTADVVFNTVPAPVVDRDVLTKMQSDSLIIDIASAPGGVDYDAARRLGVEAIFAPGIPGKVAPVSAGRILAEVLPDEILRAVDRGKSRVACQLSAADSTEF